ncbi:MAG: hypothetical protein WBN40_01900 [Pseudomonadales bacterium]
MRKPVSWTWILLFTTSGTLVCCVIPILLVSLGFGAVVATMASSASWLVALSQYKGWMFIGSGLFIALAVFAVYRSGRACPADPELALACDRADKWNRRFINLSAAMWCIGFLAAYALPLVYRI